MFESSCMADFTRYSMHRLHETKVKAEDFSKLLTARTHMQYWELAVSLYVYETEPLSNEKPA
jgi:hypothetical protein